jgi:predicted Zn-dependent protease
MQTIVKFTDSEIAAGWRIENGKFVRPISDATKKAIAEFNKIMKEAANQHIREMTRSEWERSNEEMIP